MNLKSIYYILFILIAFRGSAQTPASRAVFDSFYETRNYTQPAVVVAKTLNTATANTHVTVDLSTVIAKVRSTQFGVNTTFRNGSDQRTRSSLYSGKVTALRFPAGSGSNTYFFDGNSPATTGSYIDQSGATQTVTAINGTNSSYLTPATFIKFKNDVNGQPIVVVNYFYARYGVTSAGTRAARVQQAASYAAEFVRRMNVTLAGNIRYWEIGNECYGRWETGYQMADAGIGTVSGSEYGEDFNVFVQAMKAVDPTIKCGVILNEGTDSWNSLVLPKVKETADFISVHNYFTTNNQAADFNNILSATTEIADIKTTIQSQIVQYTGHAADYYPLAMTEFNSRGAYNSSMINGVFITEVLGELIKNNYGLACLWVSEWNWDATTKDCKAFLAKADPDQVDYSPRQAYIPYYYFGKCFGNDLIATTSDNASVKVYASRFSSGEVGLVLINKSASQQEVSLQIAMNGKKYSPKTLQWYDFYASTIDLTNTFYKKFYLNGVTSDTNGGGPVNPDDVNPYQSVYDNTKTVSLRPYSVQFMVIPTADFLTHGVQNHETSQTVAVSVVGKEAVLHTPNEIRSVEIYTCSGVRVSLLSTTVNNRFSVDNLSPGVYLIRAKGTDQQVYRSKLLIR